ncbi:Fic family protein [archaeon CG10_big_fil_rev_8_21_14_0_10_43_11]|nr:MAG: Fic family protein [archaeon CG10_big_fil_rev_8_21_14_0_10_43_11]
MVFVETIKQNGKQYFYVSKNFRIGKNKWKRIKKYAGKKKPSKDEIKKLAEEIETKAKEKGIIIPESRYAFLSEEQAEVLEDLKTAYSKWWKKLPKETKEKYESDFLVRFTYNSNAIEGNSLSLRDTNLILQENIIPSDITEREYKEVLNGKRAMEFIKEYRGEVNKTFVLKIHKLVTKNILETAGNYRQTNVIIQGSEHRPPNVKEVPNLMKKFFIWYNNNKNNYHPLELAGLVHAKFVRIHPFSDGNGRTARLIMNFTLHKSGYPMFVIKNAERRAYYNTLEQSDSGNNKEFILLLFKNVINQHGNYLHK